MNPFGLAVAPGMVPSAQEIASLKPAFLRSILYSINDLDPLLATGLPIVLTLNNQMQEVGDWSGWEHAIQLVADRSQGRVLAASCGNEFDVYHSTNPSDVPPEFANYLIQKASPILRAAGIKCSPTSLGGPDWQAYLARVVELAGDKIDWCDLHAYGKRPDGWGSPGWGSGDLRPTLIRAYEIAQKPVMMSEYGVKISDAGGESQVASFMRAAASTLASLGPTVSPAAAWFCWRDDIGAPDERGENGFGLRTVEGAARPAWDAFADLGRTPVPVPTPDPPAPPEPVPTPDPFGQMTADDASLMDIWSSFRADIPFNPQSAIGRLWRTAPSRFGPPVGIERYDRAADGTPTLAIQSFASGARLRWQSGNAEAEVA